MFKEVCPTVHWPARTVSAGPESAPQEAEPGGGVSPSNFRVSSTPIFVSRATRLRIHVTQIPSHSPMTNPIAAGDPVVAVDGLTFSYGSGEVLHGISFAVRPGEVVGLLGPNGAGKSTTIRILTGILAPGGGSVRVAGCAMPEEATEAKKRLGYVPEAAGLFESLTAEEYLELVGRLQEVPEDRLQARIDRFLTQFGLAEDRVASLDTYSKGMRQKVLLSAALLHNPDLLLLDEPLSGLDVNAGIMVRDLVAALAAEGKAVLYSSHVLDVVERVCDRALILHEGQVIADGSLDALRASAERGSLEDVFRQLTGTEGTASGAAEIVAGLRP